MKFSLVSLIAVGAILLGSSASASASEEIAKKDLRITHSNLISKEDDTKKRLYVELNDGSTYLLRKCVYEDSARCYWDAGSSGNGVGKSFVSLRGRVFYKNVNV